MTNACRVCDKSITQSSSDLTCSVCEQQFHGTCVTAQIDQSASARKWRCSKCDVANQRTDVAKTAPNVNEVLKMVADLKRDFKNFQSGISSTIKRLQAKIAQTLEHFEDQTQKLAQCFEIIADLKKENQMLRGEVDAIKRKQTEQEQLNRFNDIEIRGVPVQPNENLIGIVQCLAMALGSNLIIDENCVVFCYRTLPKTTNQTGTIHVRFNHHIYKKDLLRRRCSIRGFTSRNIQLPVTSNASVFVNESLCPEKRVLFAKTNEIRKQKHYRYLWTRDGKILVRKMESCRAKVINCWADLSTL
ncbi:conserved hypothetical protein [Nesidiocoris tenuis]|uniref:PHD-type domain-containing protein n=1 Tax=Nesidiocoris tenuis TaxID=355587 RepID=A0ABN7B4H8_9HEMI|nr:conserved hypothetical protein [Nesidiocoris tenuis]